MVGTTLFRLSLVSSGSYQTSCKLQAAEPFQASYFLLMIAVAKLTIGRLLRQPETFSVVVRGFVPQTCGLPGLILKLRMERDAVVIHTVSAGLSNSRGPFATQMLTCHRVSS